MAISINQTEFPWGLITVTAGGRTFERILEIEYDKEQEKKQIYGRGNKVKGIQRQNEKPAGSITLGQSELEAIIRQAPDQDPMKVVMDIQVHYVTEEGAAIVRDRIIGAEFTKAPKSMKQGDSDMEIKMDFLCMDILYNQ